jgi:hypothetical protein
LLVARRGQAEINGVIGFAPAFAGSRTTRSGGWWALHTLQSRYLQSASRLNALVFAFERDLYASTWELRSLGNVPGVEFELVSPEAENCANAYGHRGVFADCFDAPATERILSFIARRLRDTALDETPQIYAARRSRLD